MLERIKGKLVFRQTEIDAALEAAIAELPGSGRRISRGVVALGVSHVTFLSFRRALFEMTPDLIHDGTVYVDLCCLTDRH